MRLQERDVLAERDEVDLVVGADGADQGLEEDRRVVLAEAVRRDGRSTASPPASAPRRRRSARAGARRSCAFFSSQSATRDLDRRSGRPAWPRLAGGRRRVDRDVAVGIGGLGPDDQVGTRLDGDRALDQVLDLLEDHQRVGRPSCTAARSSSARGPAWAPSRNCAVERRKAPYARAPAHQQRRPIQSRTACRAVSRGPRAVRLEEGQREQVDHPGVDQRDQEADAQRAGDVGDLDQGEEPVLAVAEVVPGEAGQEMGPDVLHADPEDRRRHHQGDVEAEDRQPRQREEARPPEREDGGHGQPGQPGRRVGEPDPLDARAARRRRPPAQAPSVEPEPRARLDHQPGTAATRATQASQLHSTRREGRPEEQPRGEPGDHRMPGQAVGQAPRWSRFPRSFRAPRDRSAMTDAPCRRGVGQRTFAASVAETLFAGPTTFTSIRTTHEQQPHLSERQETRQFLLRSKTRSPAGKTAKPSARATPSRSAEPAQSRAR